jgi:Spy/CpxP family protein refolding chaperone
MHKKYSSEVWTAAFTRLMCLSLIFLVSACTPYYEQPPRYERPSRTEATPGGGDAIYNIERFARELKLTRPQIQKIRQLRADFDKEATRINATLRTDYTDLNNLTRADRNQLDKEAVFKKADEISELHAEMQRKILELDLELTSLLTDEQYEKFRDILSRKGDY